MKITKEKDDENFEEEPALMQSILREYHNDSNLKITKMKCFRGSKDGDNYMSVIKKVHIEGFLSDDEEFKHKFIVKRPIAILSRRKLFGCDEAFLNETNAYNHLVKVMMNFTCNSLQCFPKCYFAGVDKAGENVVVLEDLGISGYKMMDRLAGGLSLDHCKLVMQELANFHAVSLSMKYMCPKTFQRAKSHIKEIIFYPAVDNFFEKSIESSLMEGLDSLQNHSNKNGDLTLAIKTITKLKNNMFAMMKEKILSSDENWMVLCHGDLWINNLMFQNDINGKVKNVKIIDLQAMRYSSPLCDIIQFLYSSTEIELRNDHLPALLDWYLDSLKQALAKYMLPNYQEAFNTLLNQFTPANLLNEFRSKILYGLGTSMALLPAVSFEPNNIPNLDNVTVHDFTTGSHGSDITNKHTDLYHKRLRDVVFEFHVMGFLEEIE